MSVHYVSLKGLRPTNEDAHNIILGRCKKNTETANVDYYGIYDGHGGNFVSKFLSENIYQYFTQKGVSYPLELDYINKVYDKIQQKLIDEHKDEAFNCGATCLVVCQYKVNNRDYLDILNTGDSRAVLCRNNIGITLNLEHKPENPVEKRRIKKLGGVIRKDGEVFRISDLSVSRAFGDISGNKFISHKPDYYNYKLHKNDKFIIIACDGLWDVFDSQNAVNFVLNNYYDENMKRIKTEVNIARKIAEHAIRNLHSGDNVSCIIIFFD
jgi:serine/threonine protein phosphatase PrpC